jgi:hypothetical protein
MSYDPERERKLEEARYEGWLRKVHGDNYSEYEYQNERERFERWAEEKDRREGRA